MGEEAENGCNNTLKAKWGEQVPSVVDMICCPGNVEIPKNGKKRRLHWSWTPPAAGQLRSMSMVLSKGFW